MAFNECVYSEKQKTYGYDFNLNVRKLFKKDNNIFVTVHSSPCIVKAGPLN